MNKIYCLKFCWSKTFYTILFSIIVIECFVLRRENVYRGKVFGQIIIQTYLITNRQCEQVVDEKNGLKHSSPHFVGQHINIECLVTNLTNIKYTIWRVCIKQYTTIKWTSKYLPSNGSPPKDVIDVIAKHLMTRREIF